MQETGWRTVTLVLGGVRSGKSRWAQLRAARTEHVTFIATEFHFFSHLPDAVASLFKPGRHWAAYVRTKDPVLGVADRSAVVARSALHLGNSKSCWTANSGMRVRLI